MNNSIYLKASLNKIIENWINKNAENEEFESFFVPSNVVENMTDAAFKVLEITERSQQEAIDEQFLEKVQL